MTQVATLVTGRGYRLWVRLQVPKNKTSLPTVILCHGLGVSSEYPLIQTLAASLVNDGYPVCTFDFAGHGKSGGRVKDRLVQNFIKDLGMVVRYLQKKQSVSNIVLVGHSIGALAIILYAALHPKGVHAIVPIACNAQARAKQTKLMAQGKIKLYKTFSIVGRTNVAKDFWKDRTRFEPKKFVQRLKQ